MHDKKLFLVNGAVLPKIFECWSLKEKENVGNKFIIYEICFMRS